jgi:hypothetical protein
MKINLEKIAKESREQDVQGTLNLLKSNFWVFATWGGQAFKNLNNRILKFKVNGHIHKGHVYVSVNGSDLYNVYLTTTRGTIVSVMEDIYFDELVDRIDVAVEKQDNYAF